MVQQLTAEQVQQIAETWKIPAANPIDSAEAILYAFLEKYPHNQERFARFKNKPLESLKVCNQQSIKALLRNYITESC